MRRRNLPLAILAVGFMLLTASAPAQAATPRWVSRLHEIVAGHPMSVMVGDDGDAWYRHGASIERAPASNEKLLLSMALFDHFGPARTFPLRAMALGIDPDGTVAGDLYLRGLGDPEVSEARLRRLARLVRDAGVLRVDGRVVGVTGPFHRDWFAPGWKDYFPADYIPLPTALTFRGNVSSSGTHIDDPERRAAVFLSHALHDLGVPVGAPAAAGSATGGLQEVASLSSQPLSTLVRHMDRRSLNFSAEVLGKALAFDGGSAGTIANAAAAICAFEAAHHVTGRCHDASGLSYGNRQTAAGMIRLLWWAHHQSWAGTLRTSLPDGGQGTLKHRLAHVRVRAKTGTLDNVSALTGWVWSDAAGTWIEFSLLTSGMDEYKAKTIEDRVVHLLANRASDPTP
jgi:D-alanyl-D-alanine carboxypeptidase/D-alanyl-D-alanine-endopeptidase (penicillin-binding protein 4)